MSGQRSRSTASGRKRRRARRGRCTRQLKCARQAWRPPPRIDLAAIRMRCRERVEVEDAYEKLASTGLPYGPSFQGLQALWHGSSEAIAELSLPEDVDGADR